jgi:hypothetical protein
MDHDKRYYTRASFCSCARIEKVFNKAICWQKVCRKLGKSLSSRPSYNTTVFRCSFRHSIENYMYKTFHFDVMRSLFTVLGYIQTFISKIAFIRSMSTTTVNSVHLSNVHGTQSDVIFTSQFKIFVF